MVPMIVLFVLLEPFLVSGMTFGSATPASGA
jgi:ABC-type maltose transport system permease subunit